MRPLHAIHLLLILLVEQVSAGPIVGPFLEPNTPFLSSALVIKKGKEKDIVRRGILIPLGDDRWACFDTDLLRWAAVWEAPDDAQPLTYDSMAAVSYPDKKAKAKSPPRLRGNLIFTSPALLGAGSGTTALADTRPTLRHGGEGKVGPFPKDQGRWLGLDLRGEKTVLRYRIGETTVEESLPTHGAQNFRRVFKIPPHTQPFHIRVGREFGYRHGQGVSLKAGLLLCHPSPTSRIIVVGTQSAPPATFPKDQPATPRFLGGTTVTNPAPTEQAFYKIRPLAIPGGSRAIRPTDIDFLSDGTGLLTTLDGDIWRIETPGAPTSRWTRVASGLFETISLAITPDDRIFTLGRDQITELIDTNADHQFDTFQNASNAFHQTLQTRDYATSLEIGPDGSFYLAKGGIHKNEATNDNELSHHRGAILKISPDGDTVEVLADGLRLPYVGLRKDGAVFASDQQGHFIPSTPIHLIDSNPTFGFEATNHRNLEITPPLLWYPYQANRSAAGFANWDEEDPKKSTFLQLSWGGRLFGIETPATGQPFSWQLPLQFDFPSLNATRHPQSGRLYVTGLGISGYKPTTPQLSGLASIEEIHSFPKPTALLVKSGEIQITFDRALVPSETIFPASPALRLFNIQRTKNYGSGHFRWDGEPGEHTFQPRSFSMSEDRRTLTLSFQNLYRSDICDLNLTISNGVITAPLHLFTRPAHLPEVDLENLAARVTPKPELKPGDIAQGKLHFTQFACIGCHSLDGAKLVGPTLQKIAQRADEASLRQSILEPAAVVTKGYEASMPSFAGVLTDQQLADLLAYLGTLR